MSTLQYRRDIDGLRAMAILPVLLFHAGFAPFSGGYVGVDVFFVISGYLITAIIAREVEQGVYTYTNFWARRARRILPAALVLVLFTLVVGWFTMAPDDYLELGRSARAQALFSANFIFWEGAGYFDGPSELKPLLHTWSLAIEEQFYFIFPLLYMFAWRFLRPHRYAFLCLIFLISLVASIVLLKPYPSATFYLLHTRAWELLLGSLLALAPASGGLSPRLYQTVSTIGLAAILAPVFLYHADTPFPGAAALPPTLGTAAIIWANSYHHTWVSKLLSWRVFVWFGLISYSLYLWHWPLIVFHRYTSVEELLLADKLMLVGASIVLAWLSYKLVETPLRNKTLLPTNKGMLWAALVSIIAVVAIGQQIRRSEGYPPRLPQDALNYAIASELSSDQKRCLKLKAKEIRAGELCRFGPDDAGDAGLLFWGDSHATALLPAVQKKTLEHSVVTLHAAKSSCPPLAGSATPEMPDCIEFNRAAESVAASFPGQHVLLAARWSAYLYGEDDSLTGAILVENAGDPKDPEIARQILSTQLTALVDQLTAQGKQVWLFAQVPRHAGHNLAHELTRLAMKGMDTGVIRLDRGEHLSRQTYANALLTELALRPNVHVIDPTDWLCNEQDCETARAGYSLYRDDDHLSVQGAELVADMLEPLFQSIRESGQAGH